MANPLLRVYSRIPMDWNASIYYRLLLPTRTMFQMGLCDASIDRGDLMLPENDRVRMATYASINWLYQPTTPLIPSMADEVRKWPAYWMNEDQWDVAPHFVIDTDDDIFNVTPDNPAYQNLGVQLEGDPLEPGATISGENPEGDRTALFVDGKNGFSVADNNARLDAFREALRRCDLITCSTPAVVSYVLREAPDAKTIILPNCIDFNDYPKVELADHPDEIRILWQGSPTHQPEMWEIRNALKSVLEKYPYVKIIFWGADFPWLRAILPADQVTHVPWNDYPEFKLRLSMVNHDINIAPLMQNTFNRNRSAIKWYESAAIWKPAVTLAERAGAFEEIEDGETGYLFTGPEEFETKLSLLIEDAAARKRAAANAKDWVRTHRDPRKWAPVAADAFEKLRAGRRALIGEPPKPVVEEPNVDSIPAEQPNPS